MLFLYDTLWWHLIFVLYKLTCIHADWITSILHYKVQTCSFLADTKTFSNNIIYKVNEIWIFLELFRFYSSSAVNQLSTVSTSTKVSLNLSNFIMIIEVSWHSFKKSVNLDRNENNYSSLNFFCWKFVQTLSKSREFLKPLHCFSTLKIVCLLGQRKFKLINFDHSYFEQKVKSSFSFLLKINTGNKYIN